MPNYYKFAPGESAIYWNAMKEQGIAVIGWGNRNYVGLNADELRKIHSDYFDLKEGKYKRSASIIEHFNNIEEKDIIYAFQGVLTIIGRGVVKSKPKYSNKSMIKDEDYHNYIEVEWENIFNPITINGRVSSNTVVDANDRH